MAKLYGIDLTEIVAKYKKAGNKSLEQVAENIRRRMAVEGKPISYPVKWDSDKQRRAFFATNGFGQGIPTIRTGTYINSWKSSTIQDGFLVSAPHPAGAIGGMPESGWQSRIHRGRWNYFPRIVTQELLKLPKIVLENLTIEFNSG